ncbi:MAG: alanine racemase, partial [Kiritimatiellaeota bacterium]|nr:alanine racemase [Kiritimatiellota bacterium]
HILSAILPDEIGDMVRGNVVLPVTDLETARLINAAAWQLRRVATVHLKIDTGMGRLGILERDATDVIRDIARLPNLRIEGIFTHFPIAYEPGHPHTQGQVQKFLALLETLRASGISPTLVHAANSDAINNLPRAFQPPFNLVRAGLNLHGSFDPAGGRSLDLRPVLTLKTRLAAVRVLPAGHPVGYGLTYRVPRKTRVGTISAGYADGLPLALSNRGFVLVHGVSCPVLGRVSMDYTTINLENVPRAAVGDEVVCLGAAPGAPTLEDWAALKGTHPYDIICALGNRVARVYKKQ